MLIGGVAVIARGVRRLTDDVDATVSAEGIDLDELLLELTREGIVPRIPNAVPFARRNQVLLLRHSASGIDVDLSLAWLPFEEEALARAKVVTVGGRRVRVATPGDLIVYKAIAARERDRSDIERLLELHGASIDLDRVRRTVRGLAAALEHPELSSDLERLIEKSGRGSRPRSSKRRKPRGRMRKKRATQH